MAGWQRIKSGDVDVAFDPEIGNIRQFCVKEREILHTAHWVGSEAADAAGSAIDAHLAGDFLAAPFGGSDLVDCPPHGWSANSRWQVEAQTEDRQSATLKLALERPVMGARVTKEISISAGQAALYQRHRFEGGQGPLTYAHHPMIRVSSGDHIAVSPKRAALTPPDPLEPAHRLAYPARATDLTRFPAADGGAFDLTHYSDAPGHEDFVTLVEKADRGVGWTAVSRSAEQDIVIFLKDNAVMPVTMFWLSNGGRPYAPWDGRHVGVLGVEDGCAAGAEGRRAAATGETAIAQEGVATSVTLSSESDITLRHAILVCAQPAGWQGVADLSLTPEHCVITGVNGETLEVPFSGSYFLV